ncbi:hypothetical protein [Lysinibacillus antri]|uniref:Uncharacterized protein n=1 Tax=Lysinibacillus antri TaxID=2498145 RepID=A0A432LIE5_9BACI|nr:hypothetical protein [Lysinibacillus antri]RUL56854.1 hypothetical protein EK386_00055 [Lysinibacillus antri]
MNDLDEQLKGILRSERSKSMKEHTKQMIQQKVERKKRTSNWTYRAISVSACAIFIVLLATFFVSPTINNQQDTLSFGEIDPGTNIQKVIVLENQQPNRNLNLTSPFYFMKRTSTDQQLFHGIMSILLNAKANAVPWDGAIEEQYAIKDLHFVFDNGSELYLKQASEGDVPNHINYLYDPVAKTKYALSLEEWEQMIDLSDTIWSQKQISKGKWIRIAVYFVVFIFLARFMDKKEKSMYDEEEQVPRFIHVIGSIIGVIFINFLDNIIGTVHFGYILLTFMILITIYSILGSWYKEQPISWRLIFLNNMLIVTFFVLCVYG